MVPVNMRKRPVSMALSQVLVENRARKTNAANIATDMEKVSHRSDSLFRSYSKAQRTDEHRPDVIGEAVRLNAGLSQIKREEPPAHLPSSLQNGFE